MEKNNWKDNDFWKSFQDDFKKYIEDNFRLVNNNNIQKLCKFFPKQGVWIEKSKIIITKSLFNVLQKEKSMQ